MDGMTLPKFADEAEEARWWFEHRAEIGRDVVAASRAGRLGEGSVARRARKLREDGVERGAQVGDEVGDTSRA
jgi:hypothetical protein